MNPAFDYLRQADEAAAIRASAAELGAKASPLAHRRGGQAYTLENRARGIEIRLGLPRG